MGLVVLMSFLLGAPVPAPVGDPGGCHCGPVQTPTPTEPWPDDDWDDDDWDDDDSWGDDDVNDDDDDAGDDDTGWPPYTGEIDLQGALLSAACTVTEAELPDVDDDGAGFFAFSAELSGWADIVWVELRDLDSDYCEAYDPATGEPCHWDGYTRPGWDMDNLDYGWTAALGFWDEWSLEIPYDGDLTEADATGASWFLCEEAGSGFATWFCGIDRYSELSYCTMYPLAGW